MKIEIPFRKLTGSAFLIAGGQREYKLCARHITQPSMENPVNPMSKLRFLVVTTLLIAPFLNAAEEAVKAPESDSDAEVIQTLPLEDLRVFTQVFSGIRSSYIEKVDDKTLLEYAIRGMLNELDPHSAYLDASSFDNLQEQTSGEFGGLGIEVGVEDGYIKVVSPMDDTPAARAGIESGDLITKIDGNSVKGMPLDKAIDNMRGEPGSKIVLTIVRKGRDDPFDLTLIRDVIHVKSVRASLQDDHYAYLRIAQFQVHTGDDLAKAYSKLKKESPDLRGIVLDLRNNPGGVLQAAVDVVDLFLDGGMVVYTEGRLKDSKHKYFAKPGDISQGLPMVVLINDGSASASEIVAGALQDQNRAVLMGTRSFGKGSVQSVIPLTDDRAIKLTTALYFTPSGRSIQAQGIEPDLEVERVKVTEVESGYGVTEADLANHLKNVKGGKERNAESRLADTAAYNKDSQLFEALTLLKGHSKLSSIKRSQPSQALNDAATDTK